MQRPCMKGLLPTAAARLGGLMKPSVLVLRTAGTNCELETAHAFELVGAATDTQHVARLREDPAC